MKKIDTMSGLCSEDIRRLETRTVEWQRKEIGKKFDSLTCGEQTLLVKRLQRFCSRLKNSGASAWEKLDLLYEIFRRHFSYERDASNYCVALTTGKANCRALAELFSVCCKIAGIAPCEVISGVTTDDEGRKGYHAWNAIKIRSQDGRPVWCHIDLTVDLWKSSIMSEKRSGFLRGDDVLYAGRRWKQAENYVPICEDHIVVRSMATPQMIGKYWAELICAFRAKHLEEEPGNIPGGDILAVLRGQR